MTPFILAECRPLSRIYIRGQSPPLEPQAMAQGPTGQKAGTHRGPKLGLAKRLVEAVYVFGESQRATQITKIRKHACWATLLRFPRGASVTNIVVSHAMKNRVGLNYRCPRHPRPHPPQEQGPHFETSRAPHRNALGPHNPTSAIPPQRTRLARTSQSPNRSRLRGNNKSPPKDFNRLAHDRPRDEQRANERLRRRPPTDTATAYPKAWLPSRSSGVGGMIGLNRDPDSLGFFLGG